MSTTAEKTNLARIRENQRRSRARRREYVQELEHRLRLVEIKGIEASAEIQVVARKVAEENKKLRTLLNNHGVKNDTIEGFLGSTVTSPREVRTTALPSPCSAGSDVHELDQLLAPRRPSWCDAPSLQDLADMTGGGGTTDDRMRTRDTPSLASLDLHDTSRLSSAHDRYGRSQIPDQQRRVLSPTANRPPPLASPYSHSHSLGTSQLDYNYDMNLLQQHHHHSHSPYQHHPSLAAAAAAAQSYSPARGDSSTHHTHSSPVSTANSCSMAANVISSMVGADPFQVRATLGCGPGVDCVVDNNAVSNAIDQLTANVLGI